MQKTEFYCPYWNKPLSVGYPHVALSLYWLTQLPVQREGKMKYKDFYWFPSICYYWSFWKSGVPLHRNLIWISSTYCMSLISLSSAICVFSPLKCTQKFRGEYISATNTSINPPGIASGGIFSCVSVPLGPTTSGGYKFRKWSCGYPKRQKQLYINF
jgi:hypothetical protein